MTEPATGWYLYAVARGFPPDDVRAMRGLRDAPLVPLEHGGLVAVLSAVDLDEFGDEGLTRHLEDLAWLEEVARAHDEVVQRLAAAATVAPMRLATIFFDEDAVRARLDEVDGALRAALDRVQGRREWSVKGYVEPGQGLDAGPRDSPRPAVDASRDPEAPGAGAAYLRRRREETQRRLGAEEAAAAAAESAHEALAGRAVASRRLAPQDPRLTGHRGTMTLNGAYLVDDEAGDAFASAVEELGAGLAGLRLEASGPWPPYSFATLEQP